MGLDFAETRSYERLQVVLTVPGFIISAGQGKLRSAVFMIAHTCDFDGDIDRRCVMVDKSSG